MANSDYTIDYNDARFQNVENEKQTELSKLNDTYNNMIGQTDTYYNNMIQEADDYATKQSEIQQQQSDLAIEKIENEKAQTEKDYQKEQRASYADYQKQLAGSAATNMNSGHAFGGGYSESSQVGMYNTYQNRVATARETYTQAVTDYNIAIKDAQLQNSSALMEIAYNALEQKLNYGLQAFQYKNTLTTDLVEKQMTLNNTYYSRYQDVLNQMNTENSLAESIREYNENMAYQKERDAVEDAQWQKEYNLSKAAASSSGSSSSSGYSYTDTTNYTDTSGLTSSNNYGNSQSTVNKTDYYFDAKKNGVDESDYQPRYVNDEKLKKSGLTSSDLGLTQYGKNKNIWITSGGKAYIWAGKSTGYVELDYDTVKSKMK